MQRESIALDYITWLSHQVKTQKFRLKLECDILVPPASFCRPTMYQNCWRPGQSPGPRWGRLRRSLRPPSRLGRGKPLLPGRLGGLGERRKLPAPGRQRFWYIMSLQNDAGGTKISHSSCKLLCFYLTRQPCNVIQCNVLLSSSTHPIANSNPLAADLSAVDCFSGLLIYRISISTSILSMILL